MTHRATKVTALVILILATHNIGYCQFWRKKFKLPDAKVTSSQLCGTSCLPGNFGTVMPLFKKSYEPDLDENSTERLIAYSILGRTYADSDLTGSKAWRCSESTKNPFSLNSITRLASTGTSGTTFDYKRSEKLNIDVNAAAETNLEEIKNLNPDLDTKVLSEFGAKLKAAYARFAGKDLTIVGRYSQWGIKQDSVEALIKNVDYTDCKQFLSKHDYRIILAIGMVYFDISYNENSLDKIATELQSEAESYGIKGNVAFSFKREVSKDLKKVTKGYYQILVWRTAGFEELKI